MKQRRPTYSEWAKIIHEHDPQLYAELIALEKQYILDTPDEHLCHNKRQIKAMLKAEE